MNSVTGRGFAAKETGLFPFSSQLEFSDELMSLKHLELPVVKRVSVLYEKHPELTLR